MSWLGSISFLLKDRLRNLVRLYMRVVEKLRKPVSDIVRYIMEGDRALAEQTNVRCGLMNIL